MLAYSGGIRFLFFLKKALQPALQAGLRHFLICAFVFSAKT